MLDWPQKSCQSSLQKKENDVTQSVLMVPSTFFKVDYAINPFMRTAEGKLNTVNEATAKKQWEALQSLYFELGLNILQIAPSESHPDMVFTANQLLPFIDPKTGEQSFILSHMATAERAGEVIFFKNWAKERGHKTYQLPIGPFEGMGDALWSSDNNVLFLGHGFRTHKDVSIELEKLTQKKVVSLKLISPYFYHLDTCLAILNSTTCTYVKEAFDQQSLSTLDKYFETKIEIPFEEAKNSLACNLFCPDGKTIIIDQKNTETISRLSDYPFEIKKVDTSEFIKSGGSVFCLKLAF
jgi:N-dimethylarginine dimethylaminohydrolase